MLPSSGWWAVKVPALTYKSLSMASVICHQCIYAFRRRADTVKAPRRKQRFQWLMSAPTPRWTLTQTSPHHPACAHPSPSLFLLYFPSWGVISGTVATQFHTKARGGKKSPGRLWADRKMPPCYNQLKSVCDRIYSFSWKLVYSIRLCRGILY